MDREIDLMMEWWLWAYLHGYRSFDVIATCMASDDLRRTLDALKAPAGPGR